MSWLCVRNTSRSISLLLGGFDIDEVVHREIVPQGETVSVPL